LAEPALKGIQGREECRKDPLDQKDIDPFGVISNHAFRNNEAIRRIATWKI
jgi:hypothetical protein